MCGVIGYWPLGPISAAQDERHREVFAGLMVESRVRGMHCYGIGWQDFENQTIVLRSHNLAEIQTCFQPGKACVAHARYSTSGDWENMENNQPIAVAGTVLAFNGVIHMGTKEELEVAFGVRLETANDGEVFIRQMQQGCPIEVFLEQMTGSFAGVWLFNNTLYAARNARRPLWRAKAFDAVWYASTRDILERTDFDLAVTAELLAEGMVESWSK